MSQRELVNRTNSNVPPLFCTKAGAGGSLCHIKRGGSLPVGTLGLFMRRQTKNELPDLKSNMQNDENDTNDNVASDEAFRAKPDAKSDDQPSEPTKQTLCRFLVKSIRAHTHSTVNLTIDLLVERDSLLDLAVAAFDEGLKKLGHCSCWSLNSHLWSLVFEGVKYDNGWRGRFGIFAPQRHIDEQEPRPLRQLRKPLQVGQSGCFWARTEMGSFDFVVQSLQDVTTAGKTNADYPVTVKQVKLNISTKLECDFLTAAEQQMALGLRHQYEAYYAGNNVWKRHERHPSQFFEGKPNRAPWGSQEIELMLLLQRAGAKFKKSWNAILQFGLLDRPEPASSWRWYKIQKGQYGYRYTQVKL